MDIIKGMTAQDAQEEYTKNKRVYKLNDESGEAELLGVECIDCHEIQDESSMKYCKCDEGMICENCCEHCTWSQDGSCTW